RTWTATDDCGNSSTASQTINVQDITAPVISCPATVQVNCAQNVPAPNTSLVTASDACDNALTIIWVGDVVSNQSCANRYTITRTYRATDDCGNSSECSQLILVNDQNGPVMQCPMNITVGCTAEVPAPNVNLVTASDGCGGSPVITVDADVVSNQTCVNRYTITRTYRATDVCGNVSTCAQTITVFDNTPPVITCPQNVVAGDCNTTNICNATATDNCTNAIVQVNYNYACDFNFPVGNTVVLANAVDACGNTASCNFTVTVIQNPICDLAIPATLPMTGSAGNTLCVAANSNYTYSWTVSGNGWSITAGNSSNCITYTAGNSGTPGSFCVTITNQYGCSTSCCVTFNSVSMQQCTYTQGFYGGKGKNCSQQSVSQVITQALAFGSLIIGTPTTNRSITIGTGEGSCLNSKMPSGSTASILPVGNVTCATATGSGYLANGKFVSVLVGQTIALGLNIRNSAGLSSFLLSGNQFTTAKASSCTNGTPIAGTERTFCIPSNVWNHISPKTVGKLFELANQALGGSVPAGMTISDINAAVDAINNGFDGCRIAVSFGTCNETRAMEYSEVEQTFESLEGRLELTSYPNPMGDEATIEFYSTIDSKGSLDIYSSTGELVTNIFNGQLFGGETQIVRFNAETLANGIYIGKLSAGERVKYIKIIISK
ncbi:MAG: HYR domain-containing protein, partial [Flavobacteriales bacterium]